MNESIKICLLPNLKFRLIENREITCRSIPNNNKKNKIGEDNNKQNVNDNE